MLMKQIVKLGIFAIRDDLAEFEIGPVTWEKDGMRGWVEGGGFMPTSIAKGTRWPSWGVGRVP
jgi:hypothetical protein